MTTLRLLAIGTILVLATLAWFALGASVTARSGEFDQRLAAEVAKIWGGPHRQQAPAVFVEREREVREKLQQPTASGELTTVEVSRTVTERDPVPLESSRIEVDLQLEHRQKGLLWYDTYTVTFRARYRVRNPDAAARVLVLRLLFPSKEALYDQFVLRFNGIDAPPLSDLDEGLEVSAEVPPDAEVPIEVQYTSRGLDEWRYGFAASGIGQVRDLSLHMRTNFDRVDFPAGTISPGSMETTSEGAELRWAFASLVTGQAIGVDLPEKPNPGPLAARITFFAPVSLLFFVTVLVILGILRGENLHPMNYAFVSAAFFSFHLLLAYLVDHIQLHLAFALSAVTSLTLVVTYLRVVAGTRFALVHAGVAQLVFLVFFSYAFFFEGFTGLTVTVGSIVTLFVLMQSTARVDWSRVFQADATAR